jgi:hypothetical protein
MSLGGGMWAHWEEEKGEICLTKHGKYKETVKISLNNMIMSQSVLMWWFVYLTFHSVEWLLDLNQIRRPATTPTTVVFATDATPTVI